MSNSVTTIRLLPANSISFSFLAPSESTFKQPATTKKPNSWHFSATVYLNQIQIQISNRIEIPKTKLKEKLTYPNPESHPVIKTQFFSVTRSFRFGRTIEIINAHPPITDSAIAISFDRKLRIIFNDIDNLIWFTAQSYLQNRSFRRMSTLWLWKQNLLVSFVSFTFAEYLLCPAKLSKTHFLRIGASVSDDRNEFINQNDFGIRKTCWQVQFENNFWTFCRIDSLAQSNV